MHSCVRAGAFFLQRLLQNVDCEKLNFGGGRQRPDTAAPERGLWGLAPAPEIFASGRRSARRPVLEN